jgi:subtilisin family serine protease
MAKRSKTASRRRPAASKKSPAKARTPTPRKPRPTRRKLDPRLAFLLSLTEAQRQALKKDEDKRIQSVTRKIEEAVLALNQASEKERTNAVKRLSELDKQLFAPISHGLYIPAQPQRGKPWPVAMKEPFASAFILSDAGAEDLKRLGAVVRSQAGDVFSTFVPLSAIKKLEASPAVRFIELSRPLFRTLNQAVPYAQIDTLHTAGHDGAGVIVGVVDSVLDIYHPDFRTAANATRVLFLWDQNLTPLGGEAGPPVDPALPGFLVGGTTYGVEYNQATINTQLTTFTTATAYTTVRHGVGAVGAHGTHVTGIAAGNGLAQASTFVGAAPAADIIFVAQGGSDSKLPFGDSAGMADAFAYIFARASQLGKACVINMSASDNQGPHDGQLLGEQFLDNLLLTPGRAITLSAGNSNGTSAHAAGKVPGGGTANLVLNYAAGATSSDDVEIWYDGHDRFDVTVTVPTGAAIVVPAGTAASGTMPNGVQVQVASTLNDPRNGDNLISIIFSVPATKTIPPGNTTIALTGTTVINGNFQAWVDRNNRFISAFQAPFLQEGTLTLGVPATARRPITVGNHDKAGPPPAIQGASGRGPTRDGRIKPEIATVGTNVTSTRSRNMGTGTPGAFYIGMTGTSMSAPLVAGTCALLFQCRGAGATWAHLKQILENTAATAGIGTIPNNSFGFGFMQVGTACTAPAPSVDVWLRDHVGDTGAEPFTGPVFWDSPDIEVLDKAGNPVPNPTFDPVHRFNNIIRVTVRNRGTQTANNTEVYFYWADPSTNIPYPSAWNANGIYTQIAGDPPLSFTNQSNMIVIPQIAAGASQSVDFAWAPPAPGSNIAGDDHFCLLVRLENESDPSQIGVGSWGAVTSRNNIGLHNTHVQPDDPGDSVMSFYVVGTGEQDSLMLHPLLAGGQVRLLLPVRALPWRDIKVVEANNGPRAGFGCCAGAEEPLAQVRTRLEGDKVRAMTDIVGAEALELRDGIATIILAKDARLHVRDLRIAAGARMTARIEVRDQKVDKERRFVHIAQLSGGQPVGGVSLELRPRQGGGR